MQDLMKLIQSIPVWRATHVARHGAGDRTAPSDWTTDRTDDEDEDEFDEGAADSWEDEA
jgi:hypothetical protein